MQLALRGAGRFAPAGDPIDVNVYQLDERSGWPRSWALNGVRSGEVSVAPLNREAAGVRREHDPLTWL